MTYDGYININKAAGMTSHDVVAKLRRILSQKKIGHTGTLDPDVTGVLPIALGRATRTIEYIENSDKTYRGMFILGIASDTEDISGQITERHPEPEKLAEQVNQKLIEQAMLQLTGKIHQKPPNYSAVKVKGKKLYQYARQGLVVERPLRTAEIFNFQLLQMTHYQHEGINYPAIEFVVKCSKGTYVRTLCVQVGEQLKTPAVMVSLIRIAAGDFLLRDSYTIEQVAALHTDNSIDSIIIAFDQPLSDIPSIQVSEYRSKKIKDGLAWCMQPLEIKQNSAKLELIKQKNEICKIYDNDGEFIAIYRLVEFSQDLVKLTAEKVFN